MITDQTPTTELAVMNEKLRNQSETIAAIKTAIDKQDAKFDAFVQQITMKNETFATKNMLHHEIESVKKEVKEHKKSVGDKTWDLIKLLGSAIIGFLLAFLGKFFL